jgi:hypothetical protein
MRQSVLALAVFVFLMIPATSHAEWVKVGSSGGNTYYVDSKIRKHGGLIYYWELIDYPKPNKHGDLSGKTYIEADCGKFRFRYLQFFAHTQPMGRGAPSGGSGPVKDDPWRYPSPGKPGAGVQKIVCDMAN